ncbi:MAG TPA: transglutaminase domain-containing protein, partial [Lachnospiraceae bacterium]|nr:transglutaminase domain-containing protein [Lachnospiraceae bacterium]
TELSEGLKEFDKVFDEIVSGVPENASTYEKYRYLAQVLSERVDYDYSMSLPAITAPYGIITGKMICQGYAEAYQYLCQQTGLWCHTVTGASEGTSHAWNLIWLDSGTYHVDVTWADEQGEPGCPEWMCYFMLTQDEILSDHIILDGTEATGNSLFPPKEQEPEYHINEEDAIDLVKRAMDERKESASVFVFTGSEIIEGEHCLTLSAGSYSADGQKYTAMYHYAVSDSGLVYYIDILLGAEWNLYQFAFP